MTISTNWPDPNSPGVPMFPERDGAHAIQVPDLDGSEIVYYWRQNGGGWTEYSYQDAEDFLTDEDMKGWIYKGPVLTPTQINEMLAAERKHIKSMIARACNLGNIITASQRDMLIAGIDSETAIRNLGAAS